MARPGLYANIHAKRKRGGKMRKKGAKGAPKASDFKRAKQTARKIMTKLCPRGKAAAKRKFHISYAYANAYASKICAGKIKDPSGVKRKDFRGRKPVAEGGPMDKDKKDKKENSIELIKKEKDSKKEALEKMKKELGMKAGGRAMGAGGGIMVAKAKAIMEELGTGPGAMKTVKKLIRESKAKQQDKARVKKMGGGLMEATERLRRQGLKEVEEVVS